MHTLLGTATLSILFIGGVAHAAVYVKMPDAGGNATVQTNASVQAQVAATTTSSAPSRVGSEPQEASADYLLELDGLKGESSEKKKGNVEYNWKVEEGQKAAEEKKESGEKGGTEDINIGVGELQEGKVNKVDAITLKQGMKGGVSVAAGDVNGLTEQEKQEFLARVKAHAEVQSEQDLQNFARGILVENEAVEEISLNFDKIQVKHRANGKLFGFIPVTFMQEVEVDAEGEDVGRVKVKMPWYSFLIKADVTAEDIESEAQAAAQKDHKNWINVGSFTFGNAAEALSMVSNILKIKFEASAEAGDDAASSLQGSMGI